MKFKSLILTGCLLASCLLISAGGYGGFRVGLIWQQKIDQQAAVAANMAHWDMKTKAFTWGDPAQVNLINSKVVDLMDDARLPQRKPVHHE